MLEGICCGYRTALPILIMPEGPVVDANEDGLEAVSDDSSSFLDTI